MSRHPLLPLAAALLALSLGACDGDGDADPSPSAPASTAAPGVTSEPTSASTTPSTHGDVIADAYEAVAVYPHIDLELMTALVQIPNTHEALVLTQHEGVIYRADLVGEGEPTVFLDLSGKMTSAPAMEEGLLALTFSAEFESDGRFFVHYTGADPRRTVIERYNVVNDAVALASARVIFELDQPFPNHNGGSIEFGPDGYLYIALGDGGAAGDPNGNAQNLDVLLGKILRIDVSGDAYTVPADNPFASGGGRGEIWAYGMRNPWRMTFDRETGDLWAGDVGQGEWEEVDRIERGGNYGWDITEGPACFTESNCDRTGLIAPRAAYELHVDDTCAVTGGYVYRDALPLETTPLEELVGWYIYGDFCSGTVWALDTTDEGAEPVRLFDSDVNISSFAQETDGSMLLVTFDGIYELARK